jgi:phosphohistidine phosphatase
LDNARLVARSANLRFFTDGARSRRRINDVGKKQKQGRVYDQASAVPFRRRDGDLEFCLITSMSKRRWCFPKGIIDPGETPAETALKEAEEEAGLRGRIVGDPLGEYEYSKWGRVLRVLVLLMEVDHADDHWLEAEHRQRRWMGAEEAAERLVPARLDPFIDAVLQSLDGAELGARVGERTR